MIVCKYFVLFVIYSFMGWVYETIYSSIVHKGFQSRGFLYGPIIPIYGFGACMANIVFFDLPIPALSHVNNSAIFVICFIGSIFLEYITSYVLEKAFHARWWDYTESFLNINGRVCFFASCGFGVAGIIIVNGLLPHMNNIMHQAPKLLIEVIALLFMLILGMDIAMTVSALSNFTKNLNRINDVFVDKMSRTYDSIAENLGEKKAAITQTGSEFLEEHAKVAYAVGKVQDASEVISEKKDALNDTWIEKRDAIGETLAEKKASLSHKMDQKADEAKAIESKTADDILDQEIHNYIDTSTWLQRKALRNIKFSTYQGDKKNHSDRLLSIMKSKKR